MTEERTGTRYGGFWIRTLAYLVDSVLLFLILIVLAAGCAFLGPAGAAIMAVAGVAVPLLYWAVMHASARQATFGKSLLGMKVTDLSGARISILRSIGRELAKVVSAIVLMIGFLIAAFTGKKQALHDYAASTVVVRESPGHVVAALAVGVLGWFAPIALVMAVGVGLFAGLMGGLMGDMNSSMEEAKKKAQPQRTVQAAAPSRPVASAPAQVATAPAQTTANPATSPARNAASSAGTGSDAIFNTQLPGFQTPGTTRAGPAVLKLDAMFNDSFWVKAHLPALKEFDGKPMKLVVSRVIDVTGANLYDPNNRLESEFFQKVSLRAATDPIPHLTGNRDINLRSGANAKSVDKVEGTVEISIPVSPHTIAFAKADADKKQVFQGVGITFKLFKGNDAEFEFENEGGRIVSAKGFSADQKPVSAAGWSGGGNSMTYKFSAPVARVELVVAESFATRSFPFALSKSSVAAPAAVSTVEAPKLVAAAVTTARPAPPPVAPAEVPKSAAPVAAAPVPAAATAMPASAPRAEKAASAAPAPQPAARSRIRPSGDPRDCLDLATEVAVVRCAEKFR